jgi:hypothetical protein
MNDAVFDERSADSLQIDTIGEAPGSVAALIIRRVWPRSLS